MTLHKQVDILHDDMEATALCIVEEEVVTDLIVDRTQVILLGRGVGWCFSKTICSRICTR